MNLMLHNLEYDAGKLKLRVHEVLNGTIVGIFGSSGSGKTTLLELIAGFRKPHQGKIQFQQRVLCDVSHSIYVQAYLRNIGYVPQDLALFPHLSVQANLNYGLDSRKEHGPLSFQELVRILELESLLQRRIDLLSGGEKQRVAFGRAVLASPDLLLMDEPLSNLNVELKQRIRELIHWIRSELKIPIIYVSHDPDDMVTLCNAVIILENGKNIKSGDPRDLFERDPNDHFRLKKLMSENDEYQT